ncbi:MAG: DUF2269 family protein [Candidatus Dormiibacterota bacterium]
MNWLLFWLFLHITAAVIAFGPIFVFPIVGTLTAKHPQHMAFALELNHRIELRLVIPLALSMLVSGSGLIWTANVNIFQTVYLIVAVLLYLIALSIAIGVLLPNTEKLLRLVGNSSPPAGASAAPPPQVMSLIRSSQVFGGVATVLFLAIIFLMIIQPGGIVLR